MALPAYHPHPGDVLICDFDTGFRVPEMVKKRPVVVVSSRESHHRRLATVVPLSTIEPYPIQVWHHPLPGLKIKGWTDASASWAKGDMVCTVAFHRLDKPHYKARHGRVYVDVCLNALDLAVIRAGLKAYLGIT